MLSSIYSVISNLIDVGLKPNTLIPFVSALKGGVIDCVSCTLNSHYKLNYLSMYES